MKLQYYVVVDVVTHNLKLKEVAEMAKNTNKLNKVRIKQVYVDYKFYVIHHIYSYRGVPMFLLNLLFIIILHVIQSEKTESFLINS